MEQERLRIYTIDMKYILNLANVDDNVLSVSPQIHKDTRPFVGIIIICDQKKYCVPLSSHKAKHQNMRNDVDFTKIIYNGQLIGVLNFNNMIPVNDTVVQPIDLNITKTDTPEDRHYKELLMNQQTFCQQNQDAIVKKANKLYTLITTGKANSYLKRRCCNFTKLEDVLAKWHT
ncbi:MAG: type III toxin-antitoxin system ToxN/AbiQ family toxin [Clostridia bacterium]|nr:type III toxin-antitoxin system ToxN/AbiQ family toxin [Clostridia bacterium]